VNEPARLKTSTDALAGAILGERRGAASKLRSSSKIQLRFDPRRYCTSGIKQCVDRSGIMGRDRKSELRNSPQSAMRLTKVIYGNFLSAVLERIKCTQK
jgi:hypothetical protein